MSRGMRGNEACFSVSDNAKEVDIQRASIGQVGASRDTRCEIRFSMPPGQVQQATLVFGS